MNQSRNVKHIPNKPKVLSLRGKTQKTSNVQVLPVDSQPDSEVVKKRKVPPKQTKCMEGEDSKTSSVQALPEDPQQLNETVKKDNSHPKLAKSLPHVEEKDPENSTLLLPTEDFQQPNELLEQQSLPLSNVKANEIQSKSGNFQALSSIPQQDPKKPKKRKQCPLQTTRRHVQFTSDDLQDFPQQESSLLTKSEHPTCEKQSQSTSDINQPPPDKKLKLSDTSQILCLNQGTYNSNTPKQLDVNKYWISQLGLFKRDEAILHDESHQWLNDSIIYAALTLLHQRKPLTHLAFRVLNWKTFRLHPSTHRQEVYPNPTC